MFQIDPMSRTPVYEQITSQAENFILKGILKPGDQMPSVRGLSVNLSINPNTIQKAYALLDSKGIIYSVPGRGCFVSVNALEIVSSLKSEKLVELKAIAHELKLAGVDKKNVLETIDEVYDEKNN